MFLLLYFSDLLVYVLHIVVKLLVHTQVLWERSVSCALLLKNILIKNSHVLNRFLGKKVSEEQTGKNPKQTILVHSATV